MDFLPIAMSDFIPHLHLDCIHSTNDQLATWIINSVYQKDALPKSLNFRQSFLLTASQQTHGRGQRQHTWQSPKGNVYLSLYLPNHQIATVEPHIKFPIDGRLSLCVGYFLIQMPIVQHINQQRLAKNLPIIGVKWVNDLGFYQHNTFFKLAGILIEPVIQKGKTLGVIVGVGMNMFHAPTLTNTDDYQSFALFDGENQHDFDFNQVYQMITHAILQAVQCFATFEDHKKLDDFLQKFSVVDALTQQSICITTADNQPFFGKYLGIDGQGCLQMQLANSQQIIHFWNGHVRIT